MEYQKDRAWAEVSLDAIEENFLRMKAFLPENCEIISVLKANAYGHGAVPIAITLERAGCKRMAVASIEEAMELRENGIKSEILLLGPVPNDFIPIAVKNSLILPLIDVSYAESVSETAKLLGMDIRAYLVADCGLSRLGIIIKDREEAAVGDMLRIASLQKIQLDSVMTHLTAGGIPEQHALNLEQLERFKNFTNMLASAGLHLPRHCCASRFGVRYPEYSFEYIRVGSDLYGVHPYYGVGPVFKPAMQLKARIVQIKNVEAGTLIGYGPRYIAGKPMRIAVLPIGYVDGLSCRLGSEMHMLIHGKRVSQVGRLCMDYCMVDISDVPEAKEGDTITLFGEDEGEFLSVQEHAQVYGGTASELICLLGRRIPRFYYRNGIPVQEKTDEIGICDGK